MRTFFSFLLIALLAGCVHSTKESPAEETCTKPKATNGLELVLKASKASYKPGKPIVLELIMTNNGKEAFKETFRSAQIYDFVAKKEESEIWRWSHDKTFAMMLTDFALEPQESVTYKATWDQKGSDGKSVSLRNYELVGILKTRPEKHSFPIVIEIRD